MPDKTHSGDDGGNDNTREPPPVGTIPDALTDKPITTPDGSKSEPRGDKTSTKSVPDWLSSYQRSAQSGWTCDTPKVNSYTNVEGATRTVNSFVGREVDAYTSAPAAGRNPNAFTGGQNVNAFSGATKTSPSGAISLDTSKILATTAGASKTNPAGATRYVPPAVLIDQPFLGKVKIEGVEYAHYQVSVGGVTYDAYTNDVVLHGLVRLEPASFTPLPPPIAPAAAHPEPSPAPQLPIGLPTPVQPEPDWTTRTEWAFKAPDARLFQPITHYDSGSRALNFVLNKLLLPWRNLLAYTENIPLATFIGIDDALKHSAFKVEYEAAQYIMPLEGAMGLTMEIGPAVEYGIAWVATNQRLATLAKAPAYGFMTSGGVGGGIARGARSTPGASDLPAALAPGLSNPRPGEELFVGEWLNRNLQKKLDETIVSFVADPRKMARLVPPNIPYRAVPQYGGFIIEYGWKAAVESEWVLDRIAIGVPQAEQMVRGGAPDLVLRDQFSHWQLKPWDVTTFLAAERKAARGVDYEFLRYEVNWGNLNLW